MRTGIIDIGGGLRGIFGAGVFDRLLSENIILNDIYGVSAGAANAITYIGKQKGRTLRFYKDYAKRPEYMSIMNLMKTGSFLGLSYIYETLSNSDGEDPLNYDGLASFQGSFTTVVTDAATGKAVYFDKSAYSRNNYKALMASSCLPVVCKPVEIDGKEYFDGGASDPVPVEKAFLDGCEKLILILTRPKNDLHNPSLDRKAALLIKNKHPETAKALYDRHIAYNESLKAALQYEKEGRLLIIAPDSIKGLGTLTRDNEKLSALYNEGYSKAEAIIDFIK